MNPVEKKLPSVLGIKLSRDLRDRIAQAAKAVGVSDSAWLRARALDALGVDSAPDEASGRRPRIPPDEQAALAGCVRLLGAVTASVRGGRTDEAVAGVEEVRKILIPAVLGIERRA